MTSNQNLRGFQKSLSRLLVLTALIFGGISFIFFQYLFIALVNSENQMIQRAVDFALSEYIHSLENEALILASQPSFRPYILSGSEPNPEVELQLREALASVHSQKIAGISIHKKIYSGEISTGVKTNSSIIFDLCYLGTKFSSEYGACMAQIEFFMDQKLFLEYFANLFPKVIFSKYNVEQKKQIYFQSSFLKINDNSNFFHIKATPSKSLFWSLQAISAAFVLLLIAYIFWVRLRLAKAIEKNIIKPIEQIYDFINNEKTDFSLDSSISEFLNIQAKQSSLKTAITTAKMIAHDVRKPFSLCFLFIEKLFNQKSLLEVHHEIKNMRPRLNHVVDYVENILSDIQNIDKPITLDLEEHNLRSLEDHINKTAEVIFYSTEYIKFQITKSEENTSLWIDFKKLERVFNNLLHNANDAMQKNGGVVWYKSEFCHMSNRDVVLFTIGNSCDTENLIPDKYLENIFAIFSSSKKNGTGLGLMVCKKIIEAHGGKIWCTSSIERGTEFFIEIPLGKELNHNKNRS